MHFETIIKEMDTSASAKNEQYFSVHRVSLLMLISVANTD